MNDLSDAAHQYWMSFALEQADKAEQCGEVPVGAVIVRDDQVIAVGHNQPITDCDPTAHAEVVVLRRAAHTLQNYRLNGCTLYVTLEPCVMCAGAIIHARLSQVVYAASDPRAGACQSVFQLLPTDKLNHRVEVIGDVAAKRAQQKLRRFFQQRRNTSASDGLNGA